MTAAQRATLEEMVARYDHALAQRKLWESGLTPSQVDALRAALGTCGTCKHLDDDYMGGFGACAAPPSTGALHPFRYQFMPLGERCTGWTAKDA